MHTGFMEKFYSDQSDGYIIPHILVDAMQEIDGECYSFSFKLENNILPIYSLGYPGPVNLIDRSTWEIHYDTIDPDYPETRKSCSITIANCDMVNYCRKIINQVPDISRRYNLLVKLRAFE